MIPTPMNPQSYPLVQQKQAELLEACGFPCVPAGEHEFYGKMIPMWRATGEKQAAKASVIGYGGAAYGGKSYGALVLARMASELWRGCQIAFYRRTYSEFEGAGALLSKAHGVLGDVAKPSDGGMAWKWDNGSAFYMRHCQHESDVYKYQGSQPDILIMDEATSFTWFIADYLQTRNRASGEIKEAGFRPFSLYLTNPGNIGHAWYSRQFDMEKKAGEHKTVKEVMNQNGKNERVYFIPAFLEDNGIGNAADPEYEERLTKRSPAVAKALRYGDWSIFAGQRFPGWLKERIACKPFQIPDHWAKWRALDYGYKHPMTAGWATRDPGTGRVYVYRAVSASEVYDAAQAEMIKDMTPPDEKITVTFASPDMWAKTAKKSGKVQTSVDEYRERGVLLTQADNDRINGIRKIDRLLAQEGQDGKPMIQVFEPYYDVFECMETMVCEDAMQGKDAEDAKKVDGDDAFDMLKYLLTNMKQPEQKDKGKTNRPPTAGRRDL